MGEAAVWPLIEGISPFVGAAVTSRDPLRSGAGSVWAKAIAPDAAAQPAMINAISRDMVVSVFRQGGSDRILSGCPCGGSPASMYSRW
ncbi:hypothetical protein [Sphingomonas sp. PP-CE-1G-424]|uniref:hypothetical protein n=1 Tax=Sphingomonas sp. PP-CE-1G-424 TaxID=2135658 RepID=UPI0010D0E92C|nr:hypothetical protein [Sphingomonas sp. PP-CE-1G-424]TCP65382.1 hypothetical protein C8J43_11238 [Sphingomonas sp. PP-CE-1G-424]